MFKNYRLRDFDFKLVLLVVSLTIIGIFAIGSAKVSVQPAQINGLLMGVAVMIFLALFDYSIVLKFYWLFYLIDLVLLILVNTGMGSTGGGAQRWLSLAGIRFQPSELAKILLILFYAAFIMKYKDKINTFKFLAAAIILVAPPLYLIYSQPDLSTTIVVAVVFCIMLFMGGLSYKIIFGVLAVAIPSALVLLYMILQPDQQIIEEYQQLRILGWLHPEEYANTIAYQQTNSKIAIGSGQLLGKGYNTNVISSVKNGNFISEPQTDFIFAVIGEETGFVGACVVIALIILIALECCLCARKAKDLGGVLICCGVGAMIGFQGFFNIGVATGIMPNTGLPLPFVSYGLSSLLSCYMGIGLVLNVRLQAKRANRGDYGERIG